MINEIDILHERHSCDFTCHTGKDTAELLSIVSYHHNIVVELEGYYYDWRGRTILTRRMLSEGEYADTYTVYDHWGNPVAVVPPMASNCFAVKGQKYKLTGTLPSDVNKHLYIYSYDDAMRLISAKAPGVEAVTTTYDPNGLVAFTDDGNLRKSGRTRFMLYDSAARPVVTGLCDTPSGTSAVPSMHASISGTGINYSEGAKYIKTQLFEGKSVVTGVSYGKNVGNRNQSTSHFINIVGMGFETGENGVQNYFMYYDNASRSKGTNLDNNKFYQGRVIINENNVPVLYDKTNLCIRGVTQYIVTEVRRNR